MFRSGAPRPGCRALWDDRECQRFIQAHAIGRFAEIDAACRAYALDVAAEGRQVQIGFENVALGIAKLEPYGYRDLAEFARGVSRLQAIVAAVRCV